MIAVVSVVTTLSLATDPRVVTVFGMSLDPQ